MAWLAMSVVFALSSTVRAEDKSEGEWVQLFNGKDLTGWKIHPKPNPGEIKEIITVEKDGKVIGYKGKLKDDKEMWVWHVTEDGLLMGEGPSTHLFSVRDDYVNFRYKVEAKINDGGNSGQYFRTAFGPGFPAGYEAQINATHGDKIRTGSLYPDGRTKLGKYKKDICVMDTAPHKPNEWFTQEVIAKGNDIQILVNGKETVHFKDPENTYKKGHFALQGHNLGTEVWFKKIEVIELPADAK